jgi:hypothetical protein
MSDLIISFTILAIWYLCLVAIYWNLIGRWK